MEDGSAPAAIKPSAEIVDAMVNGFGFGENASKRAVCFLFFHLFIFSSF